MHHRLTACLAITLGLLPAACSCGSGGGDGADGDDGATADDGGATDGADTGGDDGGDDGGETGEMPPTSTKANVKFKGPTRLRNDLALALELDPAEVCLELGTLSCTDEVHTVPLGGMEAYHLGIYEPPTESSVTTPIAADRVVLAACAQRVDADLSGSPVIFDLDRSGAALTDVDAEGVAAVIDDLYQRGLQRRATEAEIAHHRQLYRDIEAVSSDPARQWAVASCYATLTTLEALFY